MKNRGYTIIEISIALIFISLFLGLFIKSVYVKKNNNLKELIYNAGIYKNSIKSFKDKFGFLPGDIKKTQIFELSTNDTDGNENGFIEDKNGQNKIFNKPIKMDGEITNFWIHLHNSKFIEEKNIIPYIKFLKSSVVIFTHENRNVATISVSGIGDNKEITTKNNLTPFEAYYIDQKIDDGLPRSGNVFVTSGSKLYYTTQNIKNKGCATNFEYLTTYKRKLCQVLIELNL